MSLRISLRPLARRVPLQAASRRGLATTEKRPADAPEATDEETEVLVCRAPA